MLNISTQSGKTLILDRENKNVSEDKNTEKLNNKGYNVYKIIDENVSE